MLQRPTDLKAWLCPECSTQQQLSEEKEERDTSVEQKKLVLNYFNEYSLRHHALWNERMNEGRGAHDVRYI